MRVLQVTRDFPPRSNGGLSTAVGGLVRAASDSGVRQAVISFDGYRPTRNRSLAAPIVEQQLCDDGPGVEVLRIVDASQLQAAQSFATAFGAEAVHVHHGMLWPFARAIDARRHIYSAHVMQGLARRLRGLSEPTASERLQLEALAQADVATVPSAACLAELPGTSTLPLAVHDDAFARSAAARARPRRRALFVGRLSDIKGAQELLEVAPRLADAGVELLVAGGLPDSAKAERRWRRRFAEHAPHAELLGWCDRATLAELYATSRCLVAPSWFETFGLATVEAMLHGLPVVASDAGALAALVAEYGWLVPPRDVNALARAVVAACDDGDAARQRGAAAAAMVRLGHTWAPDQPARRALLDLYAGSDLASDPPDAEQASG
jgi:glycogen synthase